MLRLRRPRPSRRPPRREPRAQRASTLTVHDLDRARADARSSRRRHAGPRARMTLARRERHASSPACPSPGRDRGRHGGRDGVLGGLRPRRHLDRDEHQRPRRDRAARRARRAQGIDTLEARSPAACICAAAGEITVLVGGDARRLRDASPGLEAMGGEVFHMGPLGSAAVIKVITNMLAFIHLVAAGEALMLAKRGGLDLAQAYDAIARQLGQQLRPRDREPADPQRQLRHRLHHGPGAQGPGLRARARRTCRRAARPRRRRARKFTEARERYGGAAWSTMVVKLLEDEVGEELRAILD